MRGFFEPWDAAKRAGLLEGGSRDPPRFAFLCCPPDVTRWSRSQHGSGWHRVPSHTQQGRAYGVSSRRREANTETNQQRRPFAKAQSERPVRIIPQSAAEVPKRDYCREMDSYFSRESSVQWNNKVPSLAAALVWRRASGFGLTRVGR